MSEEDKAKAATDPEIVVHEQLFPQGHDFPQDILEQWVAIPPEEPLVIGPMSRGSLDQFLFSIAEIAGAVHELRLALVDFSNGKIQQADKRLLSSTNLLRDGETRNRLLFEAIIRSAIEARKNAGK